MQLKNTLDHYGLVSKSLHILIAIFILGQIALGFYMMTYATGDAKLNLITLHKSIGISILMLVIIRIGWRLINISPSLKHVSRIEQIMAHSAYGVMYLLMIIIPLSGWMTSSSHGYPVSFFNLFTLPPIVSPNPVAGSVFETVHNWAAYGLLVMVGIHALAALKHHFINKDNVLRRMFF